MKLRLLTTGSRTWDDVNVLREVLDAISQEAADAGADELVVIHGAHKPRRDPATGRVPARSADWLVHLWIELCPHPLLVTEEAHPARWSRACDPGGFPPCPPTPHRRTHQGATGTYCPLAGHRRNEQMVVSGFDHAAAFWMDGSSGTEDCLKRISRVASPEQITIVEKRTPR